MLKQRTSKRPKYLTRQTRRLSINRDLTEILFPHDTYGDNKHADLPLSIKRLMLHQRENTDARD